MPYGTACEVLNALLTIHEECKGSPPGCSDKERGMSATQSVYYTENVLTDCKTNPASCCDDLPTCWDYCLEEREAQDTKCVGDADFESLKASVEEALSGSG